MTINQPLDAFFNRQRPTNGFTLIEMLAVLAILSLLALSALPVAELVHKRSKERELKAALAEIRGALDAHRRAVDAGKVMTPPGASGYPASLTDLVAGVEDARDPQRRLIYFLRRIPRDPFASLDLQAEQSWGLRSYRSPPGDPRPGEDVFDVYSLAPGVGLNGVPYREW
jgi:general secretion pathway protein G